ncbi:hypothetical protein ACKKBF_B31380 [Auxenochlorella protothecoides x Auxenochlorella symbiontica]
MTDRVLCRYYLEGTCRYGQACTFSHDLQDSPSMVCKYWAAGFCKYGDKCRYDHKHPHRAPRAALKPAATTGAAPSPEPGAPGLGSEPPASHALLASLPLDPFETDAGQGAEPDAAAVVDDDAMDGLGGWEEEGRDPWAQAAADAALRAGARPPPWSRPGAMAGAMTGAVARPPGAPASAHGLCPAFLATGTCPRGDACDRPHGEACPRCGRHALHPTDAAAAAAHLRECGARHDRLAARQAAARLECAICLERVLGKAEAGARRFGLLACDHVFCLACIRSWRQEGEVDVDTALRTCPVCRQTAFFVTPSTVWPESAEQKQAIVEGYRAKLASIDCMHFDKGRGACPFGASCHYKHAYEDGTVEVPSNRLAADEEGEVRMLQPMRLSDFITITDRRSRRR